MKPDDEKRMKAIEEQQRAYLRGEPNFDDIAMFADMRDDIPWLIERLHEAEKMNDATEAKLPEAPK